MDWHLLRVHTAHLTKGLLKKVSVESEASECNDLNMENLLPPEANLGVLCSQNNDQMSTKTQQ